MSTRGPEFSDRKDLLSIRLVPELLPEQLSRFTLESLRARPVGDFNAAEALKVLQRHKNERVIAVDLGGDKITGVRFKVNNGQLQQEETATMPSSDGKGYLRFLETVSEGAKKYGLSVGISFAGPVEGTKPLAGPNVPVLMEELKAYGGDFANLFPTLRSVSNDAVAGIIAGVVEARKQLPQTEQVIYVINGSGLGGAVLKDNQIVATEPGHIPIIDRLNFVDSRNLGQNKPCGMDGAQYTCIERVAASKAGIEDLWARNTGEQLDGRQIADAYMRGEKFAGDLYDNSAALTAHAIKGMANAFELLKQSNETAIVGHGGIFNVAGYGERVRQILQKNLGFQPSLILTRDFSPNACAEGAAISALTKA